MSPIIMPIDNNLIEELLDKAAKNPRLRQNYDLRTSEEDSSQRMLNAMMPGTVIPIHHHPLSTEVVILLTGRIDEVIYDKRGKEINRIQLDPSLGKLGCAIPLGAWHTVKVYEPSVIYESKDGRYGYDNSENLVVT